MADDETIVIRVNAAQGEAALKALGTAGIQAGKDIGSIEGATTGSTDKLAAFGAKLFGLTKIAATFGEVIRQVGNNIEFESSAARDATTATADLFTAIGSLDAPGVGAALGKIIGNLEAMRQGLDETSLAWGKLTDAASAAKFAGILKTQRDMIDAHDGEVAALGRKSEALSREIATQQAAGEVQKFIRDEIQATLDAYDRAGETVPAKLAEQAAALGIVSKAQQDAAASAAELEAAGVKSAEERSKAEQKAADEIVAALEREKAALAAKLAQDEKALADKLAKGSKLDTSQDTTDAQNNIDDLKKSIGDLESQPLLTPDQLNQLDDLKNKAADAQRGMKDLNRVFTITRDDFLSESEAADAAASAWDVYLDRLNQSQFEHERVMDSLGGATDSFDDLSGSVDDAAGTVDDLSGSLDSLGDGAKKGTDKAKEGLGGMVDGLNEAIPLAEQLRGILQEIVTLGSQADI